MMTSTNLLDLTGGVDTHDDVHVAAVLDHLGQVMATDSFPATPDGYRALIGWLGDHGTIRQVGVEGSGSYGAGLTRALRTGGLDVVEVDRPDRGERRKKGKDDTLDAIAAARAVLSGRATGQPKTRDGAVEMIRTLRVVRGAAIKARTAAINQVRAEVRTAPAALREQLRGLDRDALLKRCANLRPATSGGVVTDTTAAVKFSLRSLARRAAELSAEIVELDGQLEALVRQAAPRLLAHTGVGIDVAGQLLVTAGDNPDRIATEAQFARLCGVAPIPVSSGQRHRHRLHRGGDRQANKALHQVVISRLSHHPPTKEYMARRHTKRFGKKDVIRCLKRYVARELFRALQADHAHLQTTP